MEKINEIKAMLEDMGKDLEKFYSKGQNSAGTRLRKSLNEVRKRCQEMRNEIQTIRQDRKTQTPEAPAS